MAPKKKKTSSPTDTGGMFSGMAIFLIDEGVQTRRLQIWKQKLTQMGAIIEDRFSKNVTHVFAMNSDSLIKKLHLLQLNCSRTKVLLYQWLEDSLKEGKKVCEDRYTLQLGLEGGDSCSNTLNARCIEPHNGHHISRTEPPTKKGRTVAKYTASASPERMAGQMHESVSAASDSDHSSRSISPEPTSPPTFVQNTADEKSDSQLLYKPPDFNRNITEIFGKLIDIYRALGDDRRSFSYYKAIPVIEKLPFKIERADQVKNLPGIGKSLQDHIQEIVTTGKLSKLEHFEKDEKVRTISLFGEIWGIGPSTALKLYEKGYRTLDDLKHEESLTNSQRLGLKYYDDIRTRIPRHQVEEMERLLQNVGEEILPGVLITCGGSYRRGKASCGDMDIVITHPDGRSHIGFLPKYVDRLKEMKFLREDLVFSIHSEDGTDSGVDTYFGLCTFPGEELRHRIDFKVYPRDIYAFGLIAWTGNDVLNRRLRLLAESKGFRLDDTGLFPAIQSSGSKRGNKSCVSLKFETEKEVFDFLGFPWLEPHRRNL